MPDADFLENPSDAFTINKKTIEVNKENSYTVTTNSGSVFNIMKEANDSTKNADQGKMPIYANAYISVDVGGSEELILVADTENAGKQNHNANLQETYDANFDGVAYSLYDVLKEIHNNLEAYTGKMTVLKEFVNYWAQYGMDQWRADFPSFWN